MEDLAGVPGADLTSRRWWIGLDSWIVQDGTYTDVAVGERRQLALELGYRRAARLVVAPDHARTPRCAPTGRDTSYDVVGEVLRSSPEPRGGAFVLDVGLLAYTQWMVLDDLEPPAAGTWLAGQIRLAVDPFFYMDDLHALPGMPPLIYTWTVERVQRDLTPRLLVHPGDPRHEGPAREGAHWVPDPTRERWEDVDGTRAWEEDASYRLGCRLEPVAPVSTMRASGDASPYGPLPGRARPQRRWTGPVGRSGSPSFSRRCDVAPSRSRLACTRATVRSVGKAWTASSTSASTPPVR